MNDLFFSLAFLSQIVLISVWLPMRVNALLRHQLETWPIESYPRLYPKPVAYYERALLHFRLINGAIFLAGLFLWIVFSVDETNDDYGGVAWGFFMLQSLPFVMLEIFTFRTWKLMRDADTRSMRKAELRPRQLADVVSAMQLGITASAFIVFSLFIIYVDQFAYSWFGGYTNIAILGAGYAFLSGIVLWELYGRKKDPYQDENDRISRLRELIRHFVFVAVAVTVYGMVTISLQVLELNQFRQLAFSIYCQLLAIASFYTVFRHRDTNFEVYREEKITAA